MVFDPETTLVPGRTIVRQNCCYANSHDQARLVTARGPSSVPRLFSGNIHRHTASGLASHDRAAACHLIGSIDLVAGIPVL